MITLDPIYLNFEVSKKHSRSYSGVILWWVHELEQVQSASIRATECHPLLPALSSDRPTSTVPVRIHSPPLAPRRHM